MYVCMHIYKHICINIYKLPGLSRVFREMSINDVFEVVEVEVVPDELDGVGEQRVFHSLHEAHWMPKLRYIS